MAYIGNIPAEKYQTLQKQSFTTSATDTYTLSYAVTNPQDLALFINNVRQNPNDAYTVSGTTLTLSSAITGSDTMYAVFLGRAVETVAPALSSVTNDMLAGSINENKLLGSIPNSKLANSSITVNGTSISLGASGTISAGITEADQWRLTTNMTSTGYFTNVERVDTAGGGYLGTGMTESSGVFTFPSTGIWLITLNQLSDGLTRTRIITRISSTDTTAMRIYGDNSVQSGEGKFLYDVTNTSTHKILFNVYQVSTLYGSSSENQTHMTFIRLGDT